MVSSDWSKVTTSAINRKPASAKAIQHYIKKATMIKFLPETKEDSVIDIF